MKIIEIIPFVYPVGGAERLVLDLISIASKKIDNKVMLISLYSQDDNQVIKEFKQHCSIDIIFLNKKPGIDLKCSNKLKQIVKNFNPDIIHCHLDSILTIWLSRICKKYKTFYTFHTLINKNVVGSRYKIKNILYRRLFCKKMIKPIAISNIIKKSICEFYKLKCEDVGVVENGVPIDKFYENKPLCERTNEFIYIGRFISLKNPNVIIEAFNEVNKKHKSIKLTMMGEGPLFEQCRMINLYNKKSGIIYTGFVNDVSPYLKSSKFLILASSYEGNPMVINEAIASRCYVIATRVGGIPDIVIENINGTLIDCNANLKDNLVATMEKCLEDEDKIDIILDKNYETNRSRVSIESTWAKYVALFMEEK